MEFVKDSTWSSGFCRSTKITNTGTTNVNTWKLTFTLPPGAAISSSWNGTVAKNGSTITVTPPSWGAKIAAGKTVSVFGFCASGTGEPSNGVVV